MYYGRAFSGSRRTGIESAIFLGTLKDMLHSYSNPLKYRLQIGGRAYVRDAIPVIITSNLENVFSERTIYIKEFP